MRAKTQYAQLPVEHEILTGDEGESIIVFRENIEEIEGEEGETRYQADEYRLSVQYSETLAERVSENLNAWKERAINADYEKVAAEVRKVRDKLLEETDANMAFDRLNITLPDNIKATNLLQSVISFITSLKDIFNGQMAAYRQALRDIPQQEGFPYDVNFPVKPQ